MADDITPPTGSAVQAAVDPNSLQARVLREIDNRLAPVAAENAALNQELCEAVDNDVPRSVEREIRQRVRAFRAKGEFARLKQLYSAVRREPGGVATIADVRSVTEQIAEQWGIE